MLATLHFSVSRPNTLHHTVSSCCNLMENFFSGCNCRICHSSNPFRDDENYRGIARVVEEFSKKTRIFPSEALRWESP
uniref:GTP cyclohydrolase 1 n=1 Tax=Parascaris univalens TaxID=6257 RepID=A0A915BBX3_PARUN